MEEILQSVDETQSVFIYRGNEKLICSDYIKLGKLLAESLFELHKDQQLTVDWLHTPTHPLIFEFSLKKKTKNCTFDFWMRYFDFVFLEVFKKYVSLPEITFILTMPQNETNFFCIHVVGVEISHDDYIYLCDLMRNTCVYHEKDISVFLECPSTFPLPSCNRPNEMKNLYRPIRLVRVQFEFYQEHGEWHTHRLENVTWQQDQSSFFSQMINHVSRWKAMVSGMMPIPQPHATYLHFPTRIVTTGGNYKRTGVLKSYLNEEIQYGLVKDRVLIQGKAFFYDFLKNNSNHIQLKLFVNNVALSTWYNRFRQPIENPQDPFQAIELKLRQQCPHLKHESSPLAAVLAAYERPVYYAIWNELQDKRDIHKIYDTFSFLSRDLPSEPPKEAKHLTFDTILYCAYRTGKNSFIHHIGAGYDWILQTAKTFSDLQNHILWVQKRYYPIVQDTQNNVYCWSVNTQEWGMLEKPILEIHDRLRWSMDILNLYSEIQQEMKDSFEKNILKMAEDILDTIRINTIEGHTMTGPPIMYGKNVPEYYFFQK